MYAGPTRNPPSTSTIPTRIPAQSDNYRIVDHLSRALVHLNIRLRLHSSPTPERIAAESPHAVFVARRGPVIKPAVNGLAIAEYTPNLIKKSVVGAGHAEKRQIQAMIGFLLPKARFESADEAHAIVEAARAAAE